MAGNFSMISMMTHIGSLSASLGRAYGLNGANIELLTDVEDLPLDLDIAIPVGLLVNELTSNALKHAFPGGRSGRVCIEFRGLAPNRCELVGSDDGAGLPERLDTVHRGSMGLQLVHDLVEQLYGTFAIMRRAGTTFIVEFDSEEPLETTAFDNMPQGCAFSFTVSVAGYGSGDLNRNP